MKRHKRTKERRESAAAVDMMASPGDWRAQALEMLPELAEGIVEADSPMSLWIEIGHIFDRAYHEPRNDDLIRRIYAFADWCLCQPSDPNRDATNDLPTCVIVCLYEHIPRNKAAREDMPRWFTKEQLYLHESAFRYLMDSDEEWAELKALFEPAQPGKSRPRRPPVEWARYEAWWKAQWEKGDKRRNL